MKKILLAIGSIFGMMFLLIGISITIGLMFPAVAVVEEETSPNWSPDGNRLAIECYVEGPSEGIAENYLSHFTDEAADICVVDITTQNRMRLTEDPGADKYPVWSPNGSQIAYMRDDGIYIVDSDGNNQRRLVSPNNGVKEVGEAIWSSDGSQLLFSARLDNNLNRDIYLVDVNTDVITNFTPNNETHDISPMWTLDGTKVVFLSSLSPGYSPSKLKIMDADGTNEKIIYNQEIFYNFVSTSDSGQILFITYDLAQDQIDHLYAIGLDETQPVEIFVNDHRSRPSWDTNRWSNPVLSPDGKYLVFEDYGLLMLEVTTGKIRELPYIGPTEGQPSWSPDSQQIAVTVLEDTTGFYSERHVYIINVQNDTTRPLIQQ